MWELDHKEGWVPKNWCFWTVMLEKTLESPLDSKEIIPVNPKGNQPWIFIGRTDVGKDWEQEENGATEDEMVGWHHWFNEHEFEQTPGDSDGQGSLACCSPWSRKESDTTDQRNNNCNQWVLPSVFPMPCCNWGFSEGCTVPWRRVMAQFISVAQLCLTLCDSMDHSTPGLPVHHQQPESTQTHLHWVGDAICHLILCCPLLLLPSIFPSIRVFSNESVIRVRWPKY